MSTHAGSPERHVEVRESVGPLELFFDLVFVFAITQVTALLAADPTWQGVARGLLVLAAVWWAWVAYSWLTNTIDPEEGGARAGVLAAMVAMLAVGLAVPGAFDDDALVFALAYLVVRALHILVYAAATPDVGVQAAAKRLAPGMMTACGLLIGAAFLDGVAQGIVWVVALLLDFGTPLVTGVRGFTVSPRHFAERYGLIIIIALGESIIAIGVGTGFELDATAIIAAALGLGVVIAKWWAYFDVVALVAERRLSEAVGDELPRMARDSYSYLHLPMVTGIVLFALGMKKSLDHIHEPLAVVPAAALTCGVSVYLLGHIGFRLRNVGTVNRQRLAVAFLLPAIIPLAVEHDAIWAILAVSALMTTLVAYEVIHFRDARARVRARRGSHEGEVAAGR